mgnify:CR=1 FL=1
MLIASTLTLPAQERPRYRASVTVFFDDFMAAAESVRLIAQTGIHLANCRRASERASESASQFGLTVRFACRLIDALEATSNGLSSYQSTVLLGFESYIVPTFDVPLKVRVYDSIAILTRCLQVCLDICERHGGKWNKGCFSLPENG